MRYFRYAMMMVLALSLTKLEAQKNPSRLWADYVSSRTNNTEPILPDFSYAGYHNGEDPVPGSFAHTVFDVTDYGAIANDNISDKAAIISTIAAAESNGAGVVYFPAGDFLINESSDNINEIIYIRKSNIVLKGSGSGVGGTRLIQSSYTEPTNAANFWTCPFVIQFKPSSTTTSKITDVTGNATRETFSVQVANASGISVGQRITLVLSDNSPALVTEEFFPHNVVASFAKINQKVRVTEIHQVTAVNGNTVTFKEPIHRTVESKYNWYIESYPHIEEVGMMDLAYQGGFDVPFVHHRSWKDDSGWSGVQFNHVVNGWISNVEFSNMSQAGQLKLSANCSALNNRYEGNPGHEFISTNSSTGTVIGHNTDNTSGVWHGCGFISSAIGNVLWRNYQPAASGVEIHASQPRANCIDAGIGGFGFHMGGAVASLPNHLRHLVVWNVDATGSQTDTDPNYKFWKSGTGAGHKLVMPIVSGFIGYDILARQTQANESPGQHVDETSLYENQLAHRLGALPPWINQFSTRLKSISMDGASITDFDDRIMRYPVVSSSVPVVTAVASDASATVDIVYPAELPGEVEIIVTSTSGQKRTYFIDITYFSYTETLNNIPSEGRINRSYTGDNNIKWTVNARAIDGALDYFTRSIYFNSGTTGITSATISGGIRSFSVKCLDKWDETNSRKIELLINGQVVGFKSHLGQARYDFEVENINVEGDFVIAIRNASSVSSSNIALDDISWVPMDGNEKSGNNFLSSIKVEGNSLNPFFKNVLAYKVTAPTVPTVTVETEDSLASVEIEQASSLKDTVSITVRAENGTRRVYQLYLSFGSLLDAKSVIGENEVSVYPNPLASGQRLIISSQNKALLSTLTVRIVDLTGQLIVTDSLVTKGNELGIMMPVDILPGVYLLSISNEHFASIKRIVVK